MAQTCENACLQRARELASTPEFAKCTAAKKESRSPVRRTEESDRAATLAFTTNKVRSGTVLPGSGGAKYQATGPLPKSTDPITGSRRLEKKQRKTPLHSPVLHKISPSTEFFNSHRRLHVSTGPRRDFECNRDISTVIMVQALEVRQ